LCVCAQNNNNNNNNGSTKKKEKEANLPMFGGLGNCKKEIKANVSDGLFWKKRQNADIEKRNSKKQNKTEECATYL
jgi:hypothetical protein